MKGKIKVVGLALVAVFAMSAVMASAAQAEGFGTLETEHGNSPVTLTASQIGNQVLEAGTGANRAPVTCTGFTADAQAANGAATIEATPAYTGCQFRSKIVDVIMNGCTYHFDNFTTMNGTDYTGTVDLKCSGTNRVNITVTSLGSSICTITVFPANEVSKQVTLENTGTTPMDMRLQATATVDTEFDAVVANGCLGETVAQKMAGNGSFTGQATIQSDFNGAAEGVTMMHI